MTIVKIQHTVLAFALFLGLVGCAAAARVVYPVNTDPLESKPGIYRLDPTHANVTFAVNHLGFSFHHGRFNRLEGSLELNIDAPQQSRVFIKIDTASIDTNNVELDTLLKEPRMFNAARFPAASFESTAIRLISEKQAIIEGMLTIKGVRKPLSLSAIFVGSGTNPETGLKTVGFSGTAELKRSDFDLKAWLPFVGDKVTLVLQAEFIKN